MNNYVCARRLKNGVRLPASVQPLLDGEEEGGAGLAAPGKNVVEGDLHAAHRSPAGEVTGQLADGTLGPEGRGEHLRAPVVEKAAVVG